MYNILFLLHFLYLWLWLPALIVLGNPWVCTWRKWTRETASHFVAVSCNLNPSWFERKFGIHSSPQGLSLLEGKVRRMLNGGVGVGVPFLFGPGNPLLISVHLKDWLSANGKKKINRWIPSLPEVTSAGRYRTSVSLGQLWGERWPLDSGLFSDSVQNIRCLPGAGSLSSLALGSGDGKKVTITSLSDLQN